MPENKTYKIVIIDNSPIVIQGLVSLLKGTDDCTVVGVGHDGADLEKLKEAKKKFNTLFLELNLPATNIYRLIKDIIVTLPEVKIIAFTNYTIPKVIQDIMEFGLHACLSKTASLLDIQDAIERVHKGEHFISNSVYAANLKSKQNENVFDHLEGDNFVKFSKLTEREMDIVTLVSRGYTNKAIADKLFLSKYTIETHRKNIMKKLKLNSSGQLIYFANQQGLV